MLTKYVYFKNIQAVEVSAEIRQNVDAIPKEAGVTEVPEMAMATSKQPETQAASLSEVTIAGKVSNSKSSQIN